MEYLSTLYIIGLAHFFGSSFFGSGFGVGSLNCTNQHPTFKALSMRDIIALDYKQRT